MDRKKLLIDILRTEYNINTVEELRTAIREMGPLDITIFVGTKSRHPLISFLPFVAQKFYYFLTGIISKTENLLLRR